MRVSVYLPGYLLVSQEGNVSLESRGVTSVVLDGPMHPLHDETGLLYMSDVWIVDYGWDRNLMISL